MFFFIIAKWKKLSLNWTESQILGLLESKIPIFQPAISSTDHKVKLLVTYLNFEKTEGTKIKTNKKNKKKNP